MHHDMVLDLHQGSCHISINIDASIPSVFHKRCKYAERKDKRYYRNLSEIQESHLGIVLTLDQCLTQGLNCSSDFLPQENFIFIQS